MRAAWGLVLIVAFAAVASASATGSAPAAALVKVDSAKASTGDSAYTARVPRRIELPRLHRRWRPGTVAIREIKKYQKTASFLVAKSPPKPRTCAALLSTSD